MHIIMQTMKTDYGRKFEAWYLLKELPACTNFSGIVGCWHCKSEEVRLTLCGWVLCCPNYQQQGADAETFPEIVSFPSRPTPDSHKCKKPQRSSPAVVPLYIQRKLHWKDATLSLAGRQKLASCACRWLKTRDSCKTDPCFSCSHTGCRKRQELFMLLTPPLLHVWFHPLLTDHSEAWTFHRLLMAQTSLAELMLLGPEEKQTRVQQAATILEEHTVFPVLLVKALQFYLFIFFFLWQALV